MFKLPEKKFKVRIVYNEGSRHGRWNVEYACYRWIPNWNTINTYGFHGWSDQWFLSSKEAEEFANELNTIEDINNFHQKEFDKHSEYLAEREELRKTKYIK